MEKRKYYVVWVGRKTGVFDTWNACKEQIFEYPKAIYKSFPNKELAEQAFKNNSRKFIGKNNVGKETTQKQIELAGQPIKESISVDGAWNTATGIVEYQGVHTGTRKKIFHGGPFEDGTNNIVEFLGIVHALAYCKQNKINSPIYSDSKTAISWVVKKQARTNHDRNKKNEKLFELLDRAIKWLNENKFDNKILKWETKIWGENPADFGRK